MEIDVTFVDRQIAELWTGKIGANGSTGGNPSFVIYSDMNGLNGDAINYSQPNLKINYNSPGLLATTACYLGGLKYINDVKYYMFNSINQV